MERIKGILSARRKALNINGKSLFCSKNFVNCLLQMICSSGNIFIKPKNLVYSRRLNEKEIVKMEKVYERIIRTCLDCNKPFSISPAEQKYFESKGMEFPKRCSECRKKRGKKVEFTCVDCNKKFFLYETNIDFFKRNGLELPKRCKNCIEDKKAFKAQQEAAKGIVTNPVDDPDDFE